MMFFHKLYARPNVRLYHSSMQKKGFETIMRVYPAAPSTFASFMFNPFKEIQADSPEFMVIQWFVVLLHARTSSYKLVKDACLELYFNKKNPNLEYIPPTADALLEHSKRAGYQTGVWGTSLVSQQNLPSPQSFGWKCSDPNSDWEPVWITQGEASKECREFVKCSCRTTCTCCKCANAILKGTLLCGCNCQNKFSYDQS